MHLNLEKLKNRHYYPTGSSLNHGIEKKESKREKRKEGGTGLVFNFKMPHLFSPCKNKKHSVCANTRLYYNLVFSS
jgi:hypothetical protein